MNDAGPGIVPDTKDWTWVLARPCPDCGFDPASVHPDRLPELIHDNTRRWYDVLDRADVATRLAPHVWSALEYACHVRDVHALFDLRVRSMLEQDDPTFEGWDQDVAAVEGVYGSQDPATVIVELVEAAADVSATYSRVADPQWQRRGRRGDGAEFTVATLGTYHLHDIAHHVMDVG